MTTRRNRYTFEPLTMTEAEVAEAAFRCGVTKLRTLLSEVDDVTQQRKLREFPAPDPDTGLWNREQVEVWVRKRYGIESTSASNSPHDIAIERARRMGARRDAA